jgi:transcriptional regulator with XRE-family HTH domain
MHTHQNLLLLVEGREAARSGRGRRVRELSGLSQEALGNACGVGASAVCRWERGLRSPRGEAAVAYARTLRALTKA